MKELKYIEKIRSEDSLLSMPQSLSRILSMVDSDDFSMEDLSKIIMKDTGLTSKILRMANSAFYMQQSKISTVQQATVMLGITQVKCLALSASVFQVDMIENKYDINIKEIFSHFISVALGCKMLANATETISEEEAFIAGLLHDIGLVYLIHHFPEDYRKVMDNAHNYPTLFDAERGILGTDHAIIGSLLAEKWNFPTQLCQAIANHHELPQSIDKVEVVSIVQLAELINKPLFDYRPRKLERRLAAVNHLSQLMNIDRRKIEEVSFSTLSETISTAEYMGIDIGEPAEILGRANRELFNSYITIENLFRERQDLSQRILIEERRGAMMETKNVAIATLSHYINNSTMAISGRAQLIKMLMNNGTIIDKDGRIDPILEVIQKSIKKIMAVLAELRDLNNLEELEKYASSQAINIDDRVMQRLEKMEEESQEILTNPFQDR
jgi:putative nucleotidyltransferase with HDIG domain